MVSQQLAPGVGRQRWETRAVEKTVDQLSLVQPLLKGGQGYAQAVQAIEQILAEASSAYQRGQVLVGGSDHAGLQCYRASATNAGNLPFLQGPQQPALQGQRHVADFIEQQNAVASRLQQAHGTAFAGASEAALGVAEQFGFDEAFG
ncbi:hypothetical protein D3C76_777230 [compost metagenome]